ncbi:hypothetical protein SO802_033478 [Lithocarpus litseifolius]|uniref:Reverse transcriptase n=1 Tax=Lithocarpus litseifolius TaxID=425828 RepID=A0AAW2BET7_9ROSI
MEGQRCTEEVDIARILIEYYQGLFNTANPINMEQAVAAIPQVISPEMNIMLQEEYTRGLKRILPDIVSDSQSAFQSDKAISDNILVAFETLHHMKTQKAKKSGFMASKLDMSKAYDRGVVREDKIRGFSLCRNGPRISHLFFADDTLLFCRAKMGDLLAIQDILNLYEQASGQQVNRGKTTIFFSKAVLMELREELSHFLGVSESILKARSVIADGMLWRVGDGQTIRLYWDKWLPGKFPSKIVSP